MGSSFISSLSTHSGVSLGTTFSFFQRKGGHLKRVSSPTSREVGEGVVENQPSKPLLKLSPQPFEETLLEKVTCFGELFQLIVAMENYLLIKLWYALN